MWRSSLELDVELKGIPDVAKLGALFSLSLFWRNCIYSADYRAAEEWASILSLTPHGELALQTLGKDLEGVKRSDIHLGLFSRFYHHDVFIDHSKTDASRIREILERELAQERIKLPHRYGRLLYDRFSETYTETRTDHLMGHEVEKLLQGTPTGVYQAGKFVSGPLGIIESQETRFVPPTLELPLWHCSDTGCSAVHYVQLREPSVPAVEAFVRIRSGLLARLGPASEWLESFFAYLHGPDPRRYVDLPAVIADCVVGTERSGLLEAGLCGVRGGQLREILGSPPRRKRDSEGSPAAVARRLPPEAQLQLLLVHTDAELVSLIDESVFSRAIKVPLGETRELTYSPPSMPKDMDSQLSTLGIRSTKQIPAVNLTAAIWRAYQTLGLTSELAWRVRGDASQSPYEALVSFVRSRGPADAVRELILSSATVTGAVCENLRIPLKHVTGADSVTIDRLLWKLGFNPMQFDDSISRFKMRLSDFREVVLAATPVETEDARERVRAAGVNVFVSLEEFLDKLVSFNVWLLFSDHFLETRFRYSSNEARRTVARALGSTLASGDVSVGWSVEGENALGTLLRYLRATVEWVQSLLSRNRDELIRPERDLPHFADDKDQGFPFRHVAMWADADRAELQRYADLFGRVVKLVEESEPSGIRNGLDHFREPERFPSADQLLGCAVRLGQALDLADVQRFLPKIFWLFGRKSNRFGAMEHEFRDHAGRQTVTYGPSLASGMRTPAYENAYVLAPGNLLGMPNSTVVFELRELSEYSIYWANYPRRRVISTGNGKPGLNGTIQKADLIG